MQFIEHITRSNGAPYLTRYHLLHTPWFLVYLHRFSAGDGKCLHDHPWAWWVSLVLWGGYVEAHGVPEWSIDHGRDFGRMRLIRRRAGSVSWHDRVWIHSILQLDRSPTWTLVIVGPKVRQWGFYTRKGWIPWFRYKEERDC